MADARHDFRTVLHYAILGGDLDVITLLLKQGAKLDLGSDYQKPTALDLAKKFYQNVPTKNLYYLILL
jgi:ankyrin repeat protein